MLTASTNAPGLALVVGIPFGLLLLCCLVSAGVFVLWGRVRQ
jgi:hypothetical protein